MTRLQLPFIAEMDHPFARFSHQVEQRAGA